MSEIAATEERTDGRDGRARMPRALTPRSESAPVNRGDAARASPTRGRPRVAVALLGIAAAVLAFRFLPLDRIVLDLVEWIRGAGAAGVGLYTAAYVTAAALLLPGSVLTLGAGFAYGPLLGILIVSPVSVLAATVAFLLGRTLARERIARRIGGDPRFAAIDEAIGRDGFQIVLLLRLSPVFPFNVLNYALGLTRVRLRDYVLASFLGMLPGTFLYVYLGSLVTSAAELFSGRRPDAGPWGKVLLGAGLVATVAVTVVVTRTARRALERSLAAPRSGAEASLPAAPRAGEASL